MVMRVVLAVVIIRTREVIAVTFKFMLFRRQNLPITINVKTKLYYANTLLSMGCCY